MAESESDVSKFDGEGAKKKPRVRGLKWRLVNEVNELNELNKVDELWEKCLHLYSELNNLLLGDAVALAASVRRAARKKRSALLAASAKRRAAWGGVQGGAPPGKVHPEGCHGQGAGRGRCCVQSGLGGADRGAQRHRGLPQRVDPGRLAPGAGQHPLDPPRGATHPHRAQQGRGARRIVSCMRRSLSRPRSF